MNSSDKTTSLDFLFDFTKGDKEKIKRYITMYLSTTPQVIDEMEKFLTEINLENVRLKAHSIKPQVQYMGIAGLSALLLEIESVVAQKGDINQLAILVSSAKTMNEKAMLELKQFLNEL
jgi:hypothetical protein